ncbi:DNA-binding response regulator [Chromobacterium sp. IIBBL 290-4]|uniref:response regulator transcription factor n=1 Tax=Chromobacterium sp. IIBBL 290-4 TaxID=2953890 RepID=UPI0020B8B104|nr:DNA-binding response regulator [Chromobacterium sp. IIBBL 290-4]UTH75172.1 DNA-binding response regulator [Chromobacterium sp. IIBBL 290-4]
MNPSASSSLDGVLRGLRVLIVDDNAQDRMLLMDFLSRHGCRLYLAEDGRDGYHKAQAVRPDVILMDISMPQCDGLTACRLLKANPQTAAIPLLFLTASALPKERVEGLAAGAVDYITKPFDFEEVRIRLCIHLRMSQPPGPPLTEAAEKSEEPKAGGLDGVLYRSARKLLLAALDATPDLAGLAQTVGTNTRRLNQAFRRCAGMTVFDFLREARMKEARRLLVESDLPVQAIAQATGYGNQSNFSTAFKDRFGCPPTSLRRGGDVGA